MIYKALLLTVIAMVVAGLTLPSQSQKRGTNAFPKPKVDRALPIFDFDSLESADPALVTKQRLKASRYDRKNSQPIQFALNSPKRTGKCKGNATLLRHPSAPIRIIGAKKIANVNGEAENVVEVLTVRRSL